MECWVSADERWWCSKVTKGVADFVSSQVIVYFRPTVIALRQKTTSRFPDFLQDDFYHQGFFKLRDGLVLVSMKLEQVSKVNVSRAFQHTLSSPHKHVSVARHNDSARERRFCFILYLDSYPVAYIARIYIAGSSKRQCTFWYTEGQ